MKLRHTFLAAVLGLSATLTAQAETLGITKIVEHPALDACEKGVLDALAKAGYIQGKNLKVMSESAQGNPTTAAQIAKKFAGAAPDVVVGISTPSAQTLAASAKNIPLVFSAVTDPVGAKLVSNMQRPGGMITGVSDMSPVEAHLKLIKEIIPGAKKVGVIYNPGEVNSVTLVALVKEYAPKLGLTLVESAATKSSEVQGAAKNLVGKVDAIYIPLDNTAVSAFEAIAQVGQRAMIPVIAADTDSVKRGALAAAGFNYYDLGVQTGEMVVKILKGTKAGEIPVSSVKKTELYLNAAVAQKMGVKFSDKLINSAHTIIQ